MLSGTGLEMVDERVQNSSSATAVCSFSTLVVDFRSPHPILKVCVVVIFDDVVFLKLGFNRLVVGRHLDTWTSKFQV